MLSKSSLFVLFFCCSTISIISATTVLSKSARASEEDAVAAFQDYNAFSAEILNTKYNETRALEAEAYQRLDTMQQEALDSLDEKLTDVKAKIAEILGSLETLGIDGYCNPPDVNQLDMFQGNATARVLQCTELSKGVIGNIFAETWDDFTTQQGNYMGCVARSLGHCQAYATDERCFDHIISFIESRKINLQSAFEGIDFNFKNKLASFKMPCQRMIEFETSTYPDYVLPYLSQCAENNIRLNRPWTCANQE